MGKLRNTLEEVRKALVNRKITFVLTRLYYFNEGDPDDLDILVDRDYFAKVVTSLKKAGYKSFSHDQALGGRTEGAQINLVKKDRIKIDLHKDFTWRKTRYLDLELIWNNLEKKKTAGFKVKVPEKEVDVFLVLINIIFEKTYITRDDYQYVKESIPKVFKDERFAKQAEKYGWQNTWKKFTGWIQKRDFEDANFPVFLPFGLITHSYFEKLLYDKKIDLISLAYYLFFRTRYVLNKTLPYE